MRLEEITAGLIQLLNKNNYNPVTIQFYQREWTKIGSFLNETYGDTSFDIEKGLSYLEKQYGLKTRYNDGTLSQQRVQLLRVVNMLEDYRIHQVLTRRYFASRNPIQICKEHLEIYNGYLTYLKSGELSKCTVEHYECTATEFLDYLNQKDVYDLSGLNLELCNLYIHTFAGLSYKSVEQKICGLRHFLRYLISQQILTEDIPSMIHMAPISKSAKIPSAWTLDEIKRLISVIDRSSPIGKRNYAMILIACVLGFRVGDIKNLRFSNFDWESKTLNIIQNKTHKPLTLPIPEPVGWAVIDYIQNGRPKYDGSDYVFIKHMPPFDHFPDNDHLGNVIFQYMNKAGIRRDKNKHSGFHSLRHSAGTMLLEMGTPLPVISEVLGHSDMDVTGVYLKTDLKRLAECVLAPPGL
jgi:integrase/recombinase XerD